MLSRAHAGGDEQLMFFNKEKATVVNWATSIYRTSQWGGTG